MLFLALVFDLPNRMTDSHGQPEMQDNEMVDNRERQDNEILALEVCLSISQRVVQVMLTSLVGNIRNRLYIRKITYERNLRNSLGPSRHG